MYNIEMSKFFYALGIPGLGEVKSRKLAEWVAKVYPEVEEWTPTELMECVVAVLEKKL